MELSLMLGFARGVVVTEIAGSDCLSLYPPTHPDDFSHHFPKESACACR
jgi:hypothetical protein